MRAGIAVVVLSGCSFTPVASLSDGAVVADAPVPDAVNWQPTWPDVPTAENRDCACMSSTYTELAVGVPRAPATVTITAAQARRAPK